MHSNYRIINSDNQHLYCWKRTAEMHQSLDPSCPDTFLSPETVSSTELAKRQGGTHPLTLANQHLNDRFSARWENKINLRRICWEAKFRCRHQRRRWRRLAVERRTCPQLNAVQRLSESSTNYEIYSPTYF